MLPFLSTLKLPGHFTTAYAISVWTMIALEESMNFQFVTQQDFLDHSLHLTWVTLKFKKIVSLGLEGMWVPNASVCVGGKRNLQETNQCCVAPLLAFSSPEAMLEILAFPPASCPGLTPGSLLSYMYRHSRGGGALSLLWSCSHGWMF